MMTADIEALRVAAAHPHKGPNDTDASMLRDAASRIRGGYEPGGSHTTAVVVQVLRYLADKTPLDHEEVRGFAWTIEQRQPLEPADRKLVLDILDDTVAALQDGMAD